MRTIISVTAVLLIVFVCENAAGSKRPTNIRRKLNSNGRSVAGRRLVPLDFSRRRPSWLRKRLEKNKRKKHRSKNTPKQAKATKKKDGKSTLVDIQSSPQALQASNKRELKKNERYFDPKILEKLNRIHSMQDVIREFKPKGFHIKKERKFVRKVSNDKTLGLTGPVGPPGVSGLQGTRDEKSGMPGRPGPNYVFESKVEDVVYFGDKKVMDPAPADVTKTGCALTNKQESLNALGTFYLPNCVFVKRCSGCCTFGQECIPVENKKKTIDVFQYITGKGFSYVKKTFTEHTRCSCQCIVKASDCNPLQTYSQDRCQCECNKTPQTCPAGRKWSHGSCGCICSNRQICELTRQSWDEKSCSCICSNTKCPNGFVIVKNTCRCMPPTLDSVVPLRSKEPARSFLSLARPSAKSSSKSTFTDDFDAPSSGNEKTDTEEEEDEDREGEDDAWDEI